MRMPIALITTLALVVAPPALVVAAPAAAGPAVPVELPALTIDEALATANGRFAGRIVAAELGEGRPEDGAESVYVFRMLTERGDIISIRVDATTGEIIAVDGRGLIEARRPPGEAS